MDRLAPVVAAVFVAAVLFLSGRELTSDARGGEGEAPPGSSTEVAAEAGRRPSPGGTSPEDDAGGASGASAPGADPTGGEPGTDAAASAPPDGRPDPGPDVEVERRRYAVAGTTARQLRRSLRDHGRRMEGRTAFAWTDWSVDVGYDYRRAEDDCRIVRPDVDVRVVVTLPEWRDRGSAELDLVSRWLRDLSAMEEHEQGHVRRARRAGRRVHRALRELDPAPCALLRDRADAAVDEVLRAEREAQDAYDARTQHGMKQGAARLRP